MAMASMGGGFSGMPKRNDPPKTKKIKKERTILAVPQFEEGTVELVGEVTPVKKSFHKKGRHSKKEKPDGLVAQIAESAAVAYVPETFPRIRSEKPLNPYRILDPQYIRFLKTPLAEIIKQANDGVQTIRGRIDRINAELRQDMMQVPEVTTVKCKCAFPIVLHNETVKNGGFIVCPQCKADVPIEEEVQKKALARFSKRKSLLKKAKEDIEEKKKEAHDEADKVEEFKWHREIVTILTGGMQPTVQNIGRLIGHCRQAVEELEALIAGTQTDAPIVCGNCSTKKIVKGEVLRDNLDPGTTEFIADCKHCGAEIVIPHNLIEPVVNNLRVIEVALGHQAAIEAVIEHYQRAEKSLIAQAKNTADRQLQDFEQGRAARGVKKIDLE